MTALPIKWAHRRGAIEQSKCALTTKLSFHTTKVSFKMNKYLEKTSTFFKGLVGPPADKKTMWTVVVLVGALLLGFLLHFSGNLSAEKLLHAPWGPQTEETKPSGNSSPTSDVPSSVETPPLMEEVVVEATPVPSPTAGESFTYEPRCESDELPIFGPGGKVAGCWFNNTE